MSLPSPNKHAHPHPHSHPHKHLPSTPPPSSPSPLTKSLAFQSYPPSPIHTASPLASTSTNATSSIPFLAHLPLPSPLYAHSNRSTTSTSSQSTVQPRGGPPSPALSALSTPSYSFRRAAAPWSKSKLPGKSLSGKSLSGKSVSSDSLAMDDWAWQRPGQTHGHEQGQALGHGLGLGKVPMGGLAGSPARSEVSEGKRSASGQLLGSIGKGLGRVGSVMKRGESIRRNNRDRDRAGARGGVGARRKASKESSKDLTAEPVVEESEEWERLSGDDGIGRPFNVEHELHVSPDLEDLPTEWLDQLKSQGMSESDLLLISAARKKQSASTTKLKLIPIRKKSPPPFLPEMPRLTSMDDMSDDECGIQAGTSASTSASTSDVSAGGPFTPILPAEEPASPALPSPSSPSPSSQSREGGGQGGAHGGRSSVYSSPSSRTTPRSKRLSDQLRGFAAIPITSELGWADEVVLAMDKRSPLASVSETATMPLSGSYPQHGLNPNSPRSTSTSPSSRLIPSSPRSAKSIRRIPVPKDGSAHSVTRTQSTSPRLGSSPSPSSRLNSPSSPGQAIPWPRSPPPPPPPKKRTSADVSPPTWPGAIESTMDNSHASSIRKSSDSFGVHYSTSAPTTTTRAPPPGPLTLPDPHLDRDEVLAHAWAGPVGHKSTSTSASASASTSTWRRNGHPPTPEPFTSRPPLSPFPFPLDPPMPLGARERKHNSVPASAAATSRSGTPLSRPTSPGSPSTSTRESYGFDIAGAQSIGTFPNPEDTIARFRAALATPTPSAGHGNGNGNTTDDRASLALSMMSGDSRDSLRDIGHATVLQAYTAKIKLGHLREVSESDGERDSGSGRSGQGGGANGDGSADEDEDEDEDDGIVSAYSRESELDDDDDDDNDDDEEDGDGDEYGSRRDRTRPEFGAMDALNRAARHLAREACH